MTPDSNALITIGRNPRTAPLLGALLEALDSFADYELTPGPEALLIIAETPFVEVVADGEALLLHLILAECLAHNRLVGCERRLDGRWRNSVRLSSTSELDQELSSWLEQAYGLAVVSDG